MNGSQTPGSVSAELVAPSSPDVAQWYAVRTRSRHEKLVASQLQSQGIETYLPLLTRLHRWSDRKKQVELPLFAGYTFTRLALSTADRVRVLRTQGVVSFVSMQGTAVPIPAEQIEDIRSLLNSKVPFKDRPFLRVGQKVRIRGGALDGLEGILVAESGDHSLVISITPIQRSLSISLEGYDVEPI